MSPTVFRSGPFRFSLLLARGTADHIHVVSPDGEAKLWIEPAIELARNHGLSERDIARTRTLVEGHEQLIRAAWHDHFGA